jgi:hypothetical protein
MPDQLSTWAEDEINKIANAEELDISSFRIDGTLRKAVTIWVVRVGDDLYVRSVKGHAGRWFRGVQESHQGHVQAGGVDKDVIFEDVTDPSINDQIDAAYRAKYPQYPQDVAPMVTAEVRSTTLKLVPR